MNESGSRMMRPEDLEFRPTRRAKKKKKNEEADRYESHERLWDGTFQQLD